MTRLGSLWESKEGKFEWNLPNCCLEVGFTGVVITLEIKVVTKSYHFYIAHHSFNLWQIHSLSKGSTATRAIWRMTIPFHNNFWGFKIGFHSILEQKQCFKRFHENRIVLKCPFPDWNMGSFIWWVGGLVVTSLAWKVRDSGSSSCFSGLREEFFIQEQGFEPGSPISNKCPKHQATELELLFQSKPLSKQTQLHEISFSWKCFDQLSTSPLFFYCERLIKMPHSLLPEWDRTLGKLTGMSIAVICDAVVFYIFHLQMSKNSARLQRGW